MKGVLGKGERGGGKGSQRAYRMHALIYISSLKRPTPGNPTPHPSVPTVTAPQRRALSFKCKSSSPQSLLLLLLLACEEEKVVKNGGCRHPTAEGCRYVFCFLPLPLLFPFSLLSLSFSSPLETSVSPSLGPTPTVPTPNPTHPRGRKKRGSLRQADCPPEKYTEPKKKGRIRICVPS